MKDAPVDIHPASDFERLEAYSQVYEAWGKGKSRSEFVKSRVASIQHNRAKWWVLTKKGRVCASLGCYPLEFMVAGREVKGFGFGAVYTTPRQRRKGLAEQLCRHVAQVQQEAGCEVGLLFSDIQPDYYARMGWQTVGDSIYRSELVDLWEPTRSLGGRMERPLEQIAELERLWTLAQRGHDLWIKRSEEYWRYILMRSPTDHHVIIRDRHGADRAYLRISITGELAHVDELLMRDGPDDPWRDDAWAVVAHYAASQGAEDIQTWQQPGPRSLPIWKVEPRKAAISMLLLSGAAQAAHPVTFSIHSTDHF